jgi:probable rRNA maturation factor
VSLIILDFQIDQNVRLWKKILSKEEARYIFAFAISVTPYYKSFLEVSLFLTNDAKITELNQSYRKKNAPTNVLSFPMQEGCPPLNHSKIPYLLGDIVVSLETVCREAEEKDLPLKSYVAHMLVHGFLHLLGYDHQTDAQELEMKTLEWKVLRYLGFSMIQEREEKHVV